VTHTLPARLETDMYNNFLATIATLIDCAFVSVGIAIARVS
jgi:hypothetical protein